MKLKLGSVIQEKSLTWLWPGLVPIGQTTIIEGDPGTAKSTLTLAMCAHVSRGTDWPDGQPCPKGRCIVLNAEDPEDTIIAPRLIAAGADMDKCHVLCPNPMKPTEAPFSIPGSVPELDRVVREESIADELKLIIFDPIEAFLQGVDNYRNAHIRQALRSIELFADRFQCAVIYVRHLNKSTDKAAIYRGGGSIGMIGAARAALSVGNDPADKKRSIVVPVKCNWSEKRGGIAYRPVESRHVSKDGELIVTSKIEWDGEVDVTADDVISAESDITTMGALERAAVFLKDFLADGSKKRNDVFNSAKEVGIAAKTLERAATHIAVIKYKDGFGAAGGWIWELPNAQDEELLSSWAGTIDVETKLDDDKPDGSGQVGSADC